MDAEPLVEAIVAAVESGTPLVAGHAYPARLIHDELAELARIAAAEHGL